MAEWCAENLRNCDGWKTAGLPLSTTCDENAKLLDSCIRQLVSLTDCDAMGGFEKTCEKLAASDPEAIMSRAFLVGLAALGGKEAASDPELSKKMEKLEKDAEKFGNEREKRHVRAEVLWGKGKHHEAGEAWDSILDDHPTDLIALRFSHDAHFFNGSAKGLLNAIEKKGWMLSTHNYWHTALFHIEYAEYEDALDIFDREVGNRFNRTNMLLDMTDACSLLWRLELEGVKVGKERWEKIKRLGEHIDNHSIVFNDVHIGLALCRQDDLGTEKKLRDSLGEYSSLLIEDNAKISKTIGVPLYDGMLSYARGNYDTAVETMFPIRKNVVQIGGSHAQRDLFAQTLIQSAILSNDPKNWSLAPQLLLEREAVKLNSHLGQRLADKYRIVHSIR